MTRPCCHYLSFYRVTDKGYITHDIKKFMPGRFIGKSQFGIIQNPCGMLAYSRPVEHCCNTVYFSLFHLLFQYYNCIIEITSLNKPSLEKRLQLMKKDKGTALAISSSKSSIVSSIAYWFPRIFEL